MRWALAGFVAAGLMLGASFLIEPVWAQQAAQAGQSGWQLRVAVIDVKDVFQAYEKHKLLEQQLKADLDKMDGELRAMQQAVMSKRQALGELNNPKDRDTVEKDLADLQFDFQRRQKRFREDFVQKQADMYAVLYKEMTETVNQICQRNGIHLVLRMDEMKLDDQKPSPEMVAFQVTGKQVIYHHANLDITKLVADTLNQAYQKKP